jgi:hypothetical protein
LKAADLQRLAAERVNLTSAWGNRALASGGGPVQITSSRTGHLWDALSYAYDNLGFEQAVGGDEQGVPAARARPASSSRCRP